MTWDPNQSTRFGERVQQRRLHPNLSRRDVARKTGLSENQIALIEAGKAYNGAVAGASNPKMSTLHALADALDLDLGVLLEPRQP